MAWKGTVKVQGEWCKNSLVFATKEEASGYARDLMGRWTLVEDSGAEECQDEVTHEWSDTEGLGRIGEPKFFPPTRVQL